MMHHTDSDLILHSSSVILKPFTHAKSPFNTGELCRYLVCRKYLDDGLLLKYQQISL